MQCLLRQSTPPLLRISQTMREIRSRRELPLGTYPPKCNIAASPILSFPLFAAQSELRVDATRGETEFTCVRQTDLGFREDLLHVTFQGPSHLGRLLHCGLALTKRVLSPICTSCTSTEAPPPRRNMQSSCVVSLGPFACDDTMSGRPSECTQHGIGELSSTRIRT